MASGQSEFTRDKAHTIADCVRKGMSRAKAARLVGVGSGTVKTWLDKGKDGEEPYVLLYELCAVADAELQQEIIGGIHRLAMGHSDDNPLYTLSEETRDDGEKKVVVTKKDYAGLDLKALTWIAERKWPKDFGRGVQQHKVEGGLKVGIGADKDAQALEFKIVIVDPKDEDTGDGDGASE